MLDCCFEDTKKGFSGGLDTAVRHFDYTTETQATLGTHSAAISSLTYSQSIHSLITGSWDQSLKFWDPRAASPNTSSHSTPERIYHIDLAGNNLVVAMASRLFHIYDIRRMEVPAQERESSLKFMTRSLAVMSDGQGELFYPPLSVLCADTRMAGYATASTEGRIAVEYFDPSPAVQDSKYAFKCHRQTVGGVDQVWPVNALSFHPVSVFFTLYAFLTFALTCV